MKTKFEADRRTFMKNVVILGGFSALLGMGGKSSTGPEKPLPQPEQTGKPGQGYRLTEHVKRYYETARI